MNSREKLKRYSKDEILELYKLPLLEIGHLATERKFQIFPEKTITFINDRNINYTNVCTSACRYCAFYVPPGSERSFTLSMKEILKKCEELVKLGGTQVMLQGGINPQLGLDYYTEMLRTIKNNFDLTLHSLSPAEICHIAEIEGLSIRETLEILQAAGLDSLPGGSAEILVDKIREKISPHKITADDWFEIMETAHNIGMESTATMMFGHIESLEDRISHMLKVRELQDKTGGFRAFIAWTFSPGGSKLNHINKTSSMDYLKTIAVSRLVFDNIPHINSGWVTEGEKIAQIALAFGADDLGGILMEEIVVKSTGLINTVNIETLKRIVEDAGYKLARRDTEYRILEYV